MRLKNSALIAALLTAAAFFLRFIVTLFISVTHNLTAVKGILIVLLLHVLVLLLFYAFFRSDYVAAPRRDLKTAAAWAIVAQVLLLIALGRNGLQIFGIDFLPEILQSAQMNTLIPFFPWAASLLVLIFFIVFFKDDTEEEREKFKHAKLFGLIAGALSFLFQTLSSFMTLRSEGIVNYVEWSGRITLIAAPFVLALVILSLLFFLSFYKGRDIL